MRIDFDIRRLTFDDLAAGLFFLAVAVTACLMPAQNDTWWHLRAGQDIVSLGTVPLEDSYSHTRFGEYWPDHEWLSQVIFYGLFGVGGMPLVTLVAAASVTGAWVIAWRLTPGGTWRRLVLSAVTLPLFAGQWAVRPQVFTLLCMAVLIHLLVQRQDTWLPPLFLVWANLHGAVLLGVGVLGAALLARIIYERRVRPGAIVVGGACVAATGMTPLGLSLWTEVPAMIARLRLYGTGEWRAPSATDPAFLLHATLLASLVLLVLVARPWRASSATPLVLSCAALVLAPGSLGAVRNVPPLALLALPAAGTLLELRSRGESRIRRERPMLHAVVLGAATFTAVGIVASAWRRGDPKLEWQPLSVRAIAAVKACEAPLYNRYDDGGYLIWFVPERRVFIDSRQDPYPEAMVLDHIRVETSGDYEQTFDHHGIGCVFAPTDSKVAGRLALAGWQATYRDRRWIVLSRSSQKT